MARCCDQPIRSSCVQGNILAVIAQDIENFDRIGRDAHDFVAAIYDVAFRRDEYVFIFGQKDSFRSVWAVRGEAIELQIARRRKRSGRWSALYLRPGLDRRSNDFRDLHKHSKDIPPCSLVLRILAAFQQISVKRWIERCDRTWLLRAGQAGCCSSSALTSACRSHRLIRKLGGAWYAGRKRGGLIGTGAAKDPGKSRGHENN